MNKHIAIVGGLLLTVALAGCLISVTEKFEYNVTDRFGAIKLAGTSGETVPIDLTEDSTFDDNKDKIKIIDRAGFEAALYTSNTEPAIVDISFRRKSTDDWTLLLAGVSVAALSSQESPTKIGYTESEALIQNFSYFQKVSAGGVMELQLKARTGNDQVVVSDLLIIITFTAEA
jgi:hypothetical protein